MEHVLGHPSQPMSLLEEAEMAQGSYQGLSCSQTSLPRTKMWTQLIQNLAKHTYVQEGCHSPFTLPQDL